jgi:hypothetical protein
MSPYNFTGTPVLGLGLVELHRISGLPGLELDAVAGGEGTG